LYNIAKGNDELKAYLATQEMATLIRRSVFYEHGSSGIADALTLALLEPQGFTFGQIREGIGFDLKAWTKFLEQYATEYPDYFEGQAEKEKSPSYFRP
jgi:hypothetical protein